MSRVHHLAAWLTRMKAGDAKVFCIGFNKTGTTSLHAFFEHEGLTSMHNIAWPVESHRLTGRSFFEKTTCYTDGEQAAFHRLEEWFPNAVFVLNTRDERSWLRSRIKHVMRFGVPSGQPGCTVLDRLGTMGHEFFGILKWRLPPGWRSAAHTRHQFARIFVATIVSSNCG